MEDTVKGIGARESAQVMESNPLRPLAWWGDYVGSKWSNRDIASSVFFGMSRLPFIYEIIN